MWIWLIASVVVGVKALDSALPEEADPGVRFECAHTRREAIDAVISQFDTDGDGCVSLEELETVYRERLSWYEHWMLPVIEPGLTPAKVVERCSRTLPHATICVDDLYKTTKECAKNDAEGTDLMCFCDCHSLDVLYDRILSRQS